jgi:class 3 adenylate cyclase
VVPLLGSLNQPIAYTQPPPAIEQDVVVVSVDRRNRDAVARSLLPQGAVFLSRRFSETVSPIVRAGGGLECDPSVDGIRVVFGVGIELSLACRRALSVARDVEQALSNLSGDWRGGFGVTPDFALCIHLGTGAFGEVGTEGAPRYICAGPAVDASDRLREAAAKRSTHTIVSVEVLRQAGMHSAVIGDLAILEIEDVALLRVVEMTSFQSVKVSPGG